MTNKRFWFGMLVMVLVFGMTVVGCNDGSTGGNGTENPGGDNPGGNDSGGNNPSGDNPGGNNPGGNDSGGIPEALIGSWYKSGDADTAWYVFKTNGKMTVRDSSGWTTMEYDSDQFTISGDTISIDKGGSAKFSLSADGKELTISNGSDGFFTNGNFIKG